jgi:Spy/CpxP family protein refolding chaperone
MQRTWMNRRATRFVAVAALALGALLVARPDAAAKSSGGSCRGHGAHALEKLERGVGKLGLDEDKLTAAYAVIDEARKERRALDVEIRTAHERMRELLEQDEPNVDAVTAQADVIGGLTTQARKIELRASVEVRSMLTPEQREKLAKRRDHRGGRQGERGGEPS